VLRLMLRTQPRSDKQEKPVDPTALFP